MSTTGLDVFDRTLHKTNSWLKELMDIIDWDDRQQAYRIMRAVLHALRDRLTVEEVAQLGAQFPMLIRGVYYEGWDPSAKALKERHKEEFFMRIAQHFRADEGIDPEQATHAVFALLAHRISEGEIRDVQHLLPAEVRRLWPEPARA